MSIVASASEGDQRPETPNTSEPLSVERLAEIKDLLRYESSIAFYSHRAKESLLLLVADDERLRARVAELERERHTTNDAVAEAHTALATKEPAETVSPAQQAAADIRAMHDPAVIECTALTDTVLVTLRPATAAAWALWADLLHIDTKQVTNRGSMATAKGSWDGVPAAVRVYGPGRILTAALTPEGGPR